MSLEAVAAVAGKLGLNLLHAIVGAAGALISLALFAFPASMQDSFAKRLVVVIAGGCIAGLGTDPVIDGLHISPSSGGIVGLVLGLFGISLAMKIFDAILQLDLIAMVKARWGGGH